MKKVSLFFVLLFSFGFFVNAFGQGMEGGGPPGYTPENIKCPDGVWRSHCVTHTTHGCGDVGC